VSCPNLGRYSTGATVKWVIPDGSAVKKGQRLLELDDTAIREQVRAQKAQVEQSQEEKRLAEESVKATQKENQVSERLAAIQLKLAELDQKKYPGDDPDEKEALELKVESAKLYLQRTRSISKTAEASVRSLLLARTTALTTDTARLRELETNLADCVLTAPRDGVVFYAVPESPRLTESTLAKGESVRDGQKLLRVSDLKRMAVKARVNESQVARIRLGQAATVRVDALPDRALAGRVTQLAGAASESDWLAPDVKVYPALITLSDEQPGLKPGMSAEVRIVAAQRTAVLHVPVQAVLGPGPKRLCFVKKGNEVQEREVVTGLANDFVVEVKEGLQEGDLVLRSPRAAARRLGASPAAGKDQSRRGGPPPVVVRSVKPPTDATDKRAWINAYGLTEADRDRIAGLPTVREAVPARGLPLEARHLQRRHEVHVVATTPAYADVRHLQVDEGRFLSAEDNGRLRNVAVLGAAAADALFAGEEPLGGAIVLGKQPYVVVGVLRERDAAAEVNNGVFLPLRTCNARFGKRVTVRRDGGNVVEAIPLTEILVTLRDPRDTAETVEDIRDILAQSHRRLDWAVQSR
jgi:RND family efflux transporter MFP subunit